MICNTYHAEPKDDGFLVWAQVGSQLTGVKTYVTVTEPGREPRLELVELTEVYTTFTRLTMKNGQETPATIWRAVKRRLTAEGWL